MAIFGSKKPAAKKSSKKAASATPGGLADVMKTIEAGSGKKAKAMPVIVGVKNVLRKPRITEKAANLTSQNVYTFDVMPDATKIDVARAIKALYKVTPIKVNVVNVVGKKVALRTRRGFGVKNRNRKAYIYLKAGDKIDFA